MRIGSLFSGIGGLELGLEWAGVGHTVWQVEREEHLRNDLALRWPDAKRYDDVRTVGSHNLEPVDVICGGYPCQPFTIAGDRLGFDDERDLWPEFARILGELRPRYAVLENVAAHLRFGFDRTLADLAHLGYDAEWSVVWGCSVGCPQPRPRLFAVAYAHREQLGRDREPGHRRTTGSGRDDYRAGSAATGERTEWAQEPAVGRVVDGVPTKLDRARNKALGNAVIPQVARIVGQRILALDKRNPSPHIPSTP